MAAPLRARLDDLGWKLCDFMDEVRAAEGIEFDLAGFAEGRPIPTGWRVRPLRGPERGVELLRALLHLHEELIRYAGGEPGTAATLYAGAPGSDTVTLGLLLEEVTGEPEGPPC